MAPNDMPRHQLFGDNCEISYFRLFHKTLVATYASFMAQNLACLELSIVEMDLVVSVNYY